MARRWAIYGLMLSGLVLGACGGGTTAPTAVSTVSGQPAASAAVTMATKAPAQTAPKSTATDAKGLAAALKAAGLPIGEIEVYDATTDPNSLLGRPQQYTSKLNFTDTSIPADKRTTSNPFAVDNGGSIEVFASAADATARQGYINAFAQLAPEYNYVVGSALLRLSHYLTPDQAAAYQAAFSKAAS